MAGTGLRRRTTGLKKNCASKLQQREQELGRRREQLHRGQRNALAAAEAKQEAAERMLAESRDVHAENLRAAKEAQDKALAGFARHLQGAQRRRLASRAPRNSCNWPTRRFAKFQETAKGDLAQRQEAIATLVQPLKEQLETYQNRLQQSETAQAAALGEVKKQLEGLAQNSQTLSSETLQLRKVLSSNQARGRWGEETLRRVVEAAGHEPALRFQRANPVRRQEAGPDGASAGRPHDYS